MDNTERRRVQIKFDTRRGRPYAPPDMTTPTIEIANGDQRIYIPVSALVHFDQVVDLAHLVICGVPVQPREFEAVEAAKQSVADAAGSRDPLAALRDLAAGVKQRNDSDLTAEKLEPGQKPGEDPAVRLLEHATKCAESLGGDKPPKGTPIAAIITAITKYGTERANVITIWAETLTGELKAIGLEPSDEGGAAALHKNLNTLGAHAHKFSEHNKAAASSVGALHATLAAFGVEIQARPDASNSRRIDDASNAIALAGRRGHKLASKAPA